VFTVITEYTGDGRCKAVCPEIPGAVLQGRSIEEACEMLKVAVRELCTTRRQKVALEPSQAIKVLEPLEL